jgi:hypothetical protein
MRTKDTVLTEGERMLRAHVAGTDVAGSPFESRALFSLKHETWWRPKPVTGTDAAEPGYQWAGASSTEQEIPATPLGPAVAVAVTYCVPALLEASLGPDTETVGGWSSTSIVRA